MDDGFELSDVVFPLAVWLLSPLIAGTIAVLWVCLRDKS